jgi:[ribosomal protein S18]-alanine N-acetyltransferase
MTVMAVTIRGYEKRDFLALYKLDQTCFVPGIAYSKWVLQYYLNLPSVDCLVAEEAGKTVAFVLAEVNPPLAHIITLDVAETHRRAGVGTLLLREMEQHFTFRRVGSVLIETSVENANGIAFWEHHGYRTEAVVKRYYLGRIDAYTMRKKL